MIRLIQQRLIIPRGDTGSFSIPTLGTVEEGDIAVFSIYDPLTRKTVFEKEFPATAKHLTVSLVHSDTVNLKAKKYFWDIKIYSGNIEYNDENKVINATEINSYYSAFKLPVCEIREVAKKDVL